MNEEEEAEEDDGFFLNYTPTSIDPTPWMLIGTIFVCLCTLIAVPIIVTLDKRWEKLRVKRRLECEERLRLENLGVDTDSRDDVFLEDEKKEEEGEHDSKSLDLSQSNEKCGKTTVLEQKPFVVSDGDDDGEVSRIPYFFPMTSDSDDSVDERPAFPKMEFALPSDFEDEAPTDDNEGIESSTIGKSVQFGDHNSLIEIIPDEEKEESVTFSNLNKHRSSPPPSQSQSIASLSTIDVPPTFFSTSLPSDFESTMEDENNDTMEYPNLKVFATEDQATAPSQRRSSLSTIDLPPSFFPSELDSTVDENNSAMERSAPFDINASNAPIEVSREENLNLKIFVDEERPIVIASVTGAEKEKCNLHHNSSNSVYSVASSSVASSILDVGKGRRRKGMRRAGLIDARNRKLKARVSAEDEYDTTRRKDGDECDDDEMLFQDAARIEEAVITVPNSAAAGSHSSAASTFRMPGDTLSPADSGSASESLQKPPPPKKYTTTISGVSDISPPNDDFELHLCCGPNAWYQPHTIRLAITNLLFLSKPDKEGKRILKLALPFATAQMITAIFEIVTDAVISVYLGSEVYLASAVVDLCLEISGECLMGIVFAATPLCSHAYGAENGKLAGQYVQIASILYVVAFFPVILLWSFCIEDVLIWFDVDEDSVRLGVLYSRIEIWSHVVEAMDTAFYTLLDVSDHEIYGAIVEVVGGFVDTSLVVVLILVFDVGLIGVTVVSLVIGILFYFANIIFTFQRGWMEIFREGLIGSFAMKNLSAVNQVIKTAVPLSIGSLLADGEWEVLTVVAAHLGPAEVAAWSLLGTLWDLFESTTEGIADAGEVRCAYHLGKGNPQMARISSYKSILLGVIIAFTVSCVLFVLGWWLPSWLTKDPVIQNMIGDLIPLVAIGNVVMTYGMVAWTLVGAQGRYRLATTVAFFTGWCLVMPLAAVFVYGFNINLQGMVACVIVGDSVTAMILCSVLIRSDWDKLSKIVQEINGDNLSSDSSSSSSSSSSPSSSSVSTNLKVMS